mgnify:CR=1 FL=1
MVKKIIRLYNTVKYLKLKQIFWQIFKFLPRSISELNVYPKIYFDQQSNDFIQRKSITSDFIHFTFLNETYMEEDSFELSVMAKSFSLTDDYTFKSRKQFNWQGYHALDATYEGKKNSVLVIRKTVNGEGDNRSNQNFQTFAKAMPWNQILSANFCLEKRKSGNV